MYENLGFENIKTYLQSGNVIFSGKETDTKKIESKIAKQIEKDLGFIVPIIVLASGQLQNILEQNPFTKDVRKDEGFLHITFLAYTPQDFDKKDIEARLHENEAAHFSTNAVYLYCPNGYGNTKLNNNFLEKKLQVTATTRNWKTCKELLKLATESTSTL